MPGRFAHRSFIFRGVWLAVLLFSHSFGLAACREQVGPPQLVLLYATCTLGTDYLAPYRGDVSLTPHLARFADQALVFDRHQTESGNSGISYASIFSGLQAPQHGVFAHPRALDDSVRLVTEAFRDGGYEVYAWLNHPMASAALNYAQGVDAERTFNTLLLADDVAFQTLLDGLADDPGRRAFVVTNFSVTHSPYFGASLGALCRAHPRDCGALEDVKAFRRYRGIYHRNHLGLALDFERTVVRLGLGKSDVEALAATIELLYKAGVYDLDQRFGAVMAEIEQRELTGRSLTVFTADHGERMLRGGILFPWFHGYELSPEVLNVPLMIGGRGVGVPSGRYSGVTRSIDVFPTLAGLAGLEEPSYQGPGVDLSEAVHGRAPAPSLIALSHSTLLPHPVERDTREFEWFRSYFPGRDPQFMWVSAREGDRVMKLHRKPPNDFSVAVFDLATDPGGLRNTYDEADPAQAELRSRLERYREDLVSAYGVWKGRGGGISEAERAELLRSLGYIE